MYDSHELFTETPELNNRYLTKFIWKIIERSCIKKANAIMTVCNSISEILNEKYNINCYVIRNLPLKIHQFNNIPLSTIKPKILLYQGAINKDRGLEQLVGAMQYIKGCELHIAGKGDIDNKIRNLAKELNVINKVIFHGRLLPNDLKQLTSRATLGFSIELPSCDSYKFALPNKLFDYIQSNIPVVISNLPEMRKIIEKYNIGFICEDISPTGLSSLINDIISNINLLKEKKEKCKLAAAELCWEKESSKLIEIYKNL